MMDLLTQPAHCLFSDMAWAGTDRRQSRRLGLEDQCDPRWPGLSMPTRPLRYDERTSRAVIARVARQGLIQHHPGYPGTK